MQVRTRSLEVETLEGTPSISQQHGGERTNVGAVGTERKTYQVIHHYKLCKVFWEQKKGTCPSSRTWRCSNDTSELLSQNKSVGKGRRKALELHGSRSEILKLPFTSQKVAKDANHANDSLSHSHASVEMLWRLSGHRNMEFQFETCSGPSARSYSAINNEPKPLNIFKSANRLKDSR